MIVSGLLPRKDKQNKRINKLNETVEKDLSMKNNVSYVNHYNIKTQELRDRKHLTDKGTKQFAKNLKGTYFNTRKPTERRNSKTPHNQNFGTKHNSTQRNQTNSQRYPNYGRYFSTPPLPTNYLIPIQPTIQPATHPAHISTTTPHTLSHTSTNNTI